MPLRCAGRWPALPVFVGLWVGAAILPLAVGVILSVLRRRGMHVVWGLTGQGYTQLAETGRLGVVLHTALIALLVSTVCLACGLPLAVWLAHGARSKMAVRFVWICLTVPFFLDPASRALSLRLMLGAHGVINTGLMALHLAKKPLDWLLFSDFAVFLGLLGPYFPNMVWPIALSVMLIDGALLEASADLGAGPFETFRLTLLPLAAPGVIAGLVMTFIPMLGDGVVPALLGGGRREYLADAVSSLSTSMNYGSAAALATVVLALLAGLSVSGLLAWRNLSGRLA